jgi:hypothetical protein
MTDLSDNFFNALLKRYEADKSQALVSIQLLLSNSVGIGEHSNVLEELDSWVKALAEAEEKLSTLKNNFPHLLVKTLKP